MDYPSIGRRLSERKRICSAALSDSWVEDHGHHLGAEVPNALLPCFVAPTGSSIWMFYGILMDLSWFLDGFWVDNWVDVS